MFQRSQKVQSANHKLKNKKYECSPIGIYTAVLTEWKLSNETQGKLRLGSDTMPCIDSHGSPIQN